MKLSVTHKILKKHLVSGTLREGEEIGIKIDQTLTQDATGTMVYLEFEAMGKDKIGTELSASYVDHNLLQTDFRNADDHLFLQTFAARYGIYFSKPGGGICHQIHLERFSRPGATLLGSDSHTPTCGGIGMLAMGAGGLDVALALAGYPFYLKMPKIIGIKLQGKLSPWVSAKDVILYLLGKLTVRGGLGKIIEYFGPGVSTLSVTERATITNMGAELGATTSIFPSDKNTRYFLAAHGREDLWEEIISEGEEAYDEIIEVDLSAIEPMVALPSSPDFVKPVRKVEGIPVSQVIIGSCSNSSLRDLLLVSEVIKDKKVYPSTSLEINPGSSRVLSNLIKKGGLVRLINAGCRLHQAGCLGCIGMGQAPPTGSNSLRTFTRNFKGRSGTKDDNVYLCSPETAVASAIYGKLTDPRILGKYPSIDEDSIYLDGDNFIIPPVSDPEKIEIIRGPNILPFPELDPLPEAIKGRVVIFLGDNVTTDDILPGGSKILPLRSNIPAISRYIFSQIDPKFFERVRNLKGGIIVAGHNYGQGSSREHAAIVPRYLGIRIKLAKSFARIHRANLINFGVLPLVFEKEEDYDLFQEGSLIEILNLKDRIKDGASVIPIKIEDKIVHTRLDVTERERKAIIMGGMINLVRHL